MNTPDLDRLKREARADAKARLAAMSPAQREAGSALVRDRVLGLDVVARLGEGSIVLSYAPVGHEVDVREIGRRLLARGATVCLPGVEWGTGGLRVLRVRSVDEGLVRGRHGIAEPDPGEPVDPGAVGVVLVPGLAFDDALGRLGRGGGFYDRFLTGPGARAYRIGIGFDTQVVPRVPAGDGDARMDAVVTPGRVVAAGPGGPNPRAAV